MMPLLAWLLGALVAIPAARAQAPASATERAAAVLRKHDPLRDGAGAPELLPADRSLDAAIGELARTTGTERIVQQRALRLARAIGLAERVRTSEARRDAAFWLAFAELDRGVPDAVRTLLLARAFADAKVLAAARDELAAATATARAFCTEWNETREPDAPETVKRRYDELEAALKKAGPAAVPHLLQVLAVLPELSFVDALDDGAPSARAQVRAIFAFAVYLELREAMPCFVMHAAGPSLTQSSNAAAAAQKFAGESFGAGVLRPGDDNALLAWWEQHRKEHEIVLDHVVHEVVRRARPEFDKPDPRGDNARWAAPRRLERLLGDIGIPGKDAGREVLDAIVQHAEDEWLRHRAAATATTNERAK